jgi:hypothetical protein
MSLTPPPPPMMTMTAPASPQCNFRCPKCYCHWNNYRVSFVIVITSAAIPGGGRREQHLPPNLSKGVEDAMGETINEFPWQSTQDERIVIGVDVGVLIWQPCTTVPLGFDFKDKTLAGWRTIPQKKELCVGLLEKTTSKQRHPLIL